MNLDSRIGKLEQRASIGASCAKCDGAQGFTFTLTPQGNAPYSPQALPQAAPERCEVCGRSTVNFTITPGTKEMLTGEDKTAMVPSLSS
jgi:hypothetical protein